MINAFVFPINGTFYKLFLPRSFRPKISIERIKKKKKNTKLTI